LLREPGVAPLILADSVGLIVRSTIHLHRQSCRNAVEVEDVWADWMLAAEAEVGELPAAQFGPEPRFWRR
jgi:hypothetical protein